MHIRENRLYQKGWSTEEVGYLRTFIKKKNNHSKALLFHVLAEHLLFWFVIFFAIITNIFIAMVFFPFIFLITDISIFFAVALLGFVFGWLYATIVRNHEKGHSIRHALGLACIIIISLLSTGILFKETRTPYERFFLFAIYLLFYGIPFVFPRRNNEPV